ncbi:MAG TPA: hypothetical protein VF805_04810, partial [Anaeromyxobacteraceae bacterium]
GGRQILSWLPDLEPDRSRVGGAVARALAELFHAAQARHEPALVVEIDGAPAQDHPLAGHLAAAGFQPSSAGLQIGRASAPASLPSPADLH